MVRVVINALKRRLYWSQVNRAAVCRSGVGDGASRAAHRRLFTALGVLLCRTPMHGVATLRIGAAHVNALNWARLCALEAGLALQRAALVGDEFEAATVARRDVGLHLWVHHRLLRLEESSQREAHPADNS